MDHQKRYDNYKKIFKMLEISIMSGIIISLNGLIRRLNKKEGKKTVNLNIH